MMLVGRVLSVAGMLGIVFGVHDVPHPADLYILGSVVMMLLGLVALVLDK